VTSFDDIKVHDVFEGDDVLLFEYPDISINVKVLQMLLPLLEPDHAHNRLQHVLERLISALSRAAHDHLVELLEDLVLLEDHRASPAAVINRKIKDPLMRGRAADCPQEVLEVFLGLQIVLVKDGHF